MKQFLFIGITLLVFSCQDNFLNSIEPPEIADTDFSVLEAKSWFNSNQAILKQQNSGKGIFVGQDFYWDFAEKETHNEGETYYVQFMENNIYAIHSDNINEHGSDKSKIEKFENPFNNVQKIAITKDKNGKMSFQYVLYLTDEKTLKQNKSVLKEFSGQVLFFNENVDLTEGIEYNKGRVKKSFIADSKNNIEEARRCQNCWGYYIDYYSYAYGGGYSGPYQYMYTASYTICVPCNGTSGNTITYSGFGGTSGGGYSATFAPDGSFTDGFVGLPYNLSKTII